MKALTWEEFKDFVDAELARQGISPATPIAFIDISYPYEHYELVVVLDEAGLMI